MSYFTNLNWIMLELWNTIKGDERLNRKRPPTTVEEASRNENLANSKVGKHRVNPKSLL